MGLTIPGEPDRAPDHGQGKVQVRPVPDRSRSVRSGHPVGRRPVDPVLRARAAGGYRV